MQNFDHSKKFSFKFFLKELTGAIGDYGTILPIVLGVAVVTDVNLAHILLFFSLWYIISGLYFRLPVPIEPMKAIGAIVIAEGISGEQIAASGIIIGILFLILGFLKAFSFIQKKVPTSVIRGIQLGLAIVLLRTSFGFFVDDLLIAVVCTGVILLFFVLNNKKYFPDISALVVIVFGVFWGIHEFGFPSISIMRLPGLIIPSKEDFVVGGWLLALPQAPLTASNAILATSLLITDTFKKSISPDKLSRSTGIMNLISVPLGGFPMCHGAGGLAAQYRFGARTGISNILSGIILLPVALFFASPYLISIIPVGVFGALLVFVAIEIGKHGLKTDSYIITLVIAILSVLINFTIAFIIGMIIYYLLRKVL